MASRRATTSTHSCSSMVRDHTRRISSSGPSTLRLRGVEGPLLEILRVWSRTIDEQECVLVVALREAIDLGATGPLVGQLLGRVHELLVGPAAVLRRLDPCFLEQLQVDVLVPG